MSAYSAYFERIATNHSQDDAKITLAINIDFSVGMTLLPRALPSMEKLDIGLDIFECMCPSMGDANVYSAVYNFRKDRRSLTVGPLMSTLNPPAHLNSVTDVNIRVFWGDHYQRGRTFSDTLNKPIQEGMQDLYIWELKQQIPAKHITSHLKHACS